MYNEEHFSFPSYLPKKGGGDFLIFFFSLSFMEVPGERQGMSQREAQSS